MTDRIGIRMKFPEGAGCILWTNGKKYYAVCEAFGTIFTINIPRNIGDDIWDRFKTHYEGNYFYKPFNHNYIPIVWIKHQSIVA